MLIPQYSLRWLLAATAVCAVIFSLVGLALHGSRWPAAISIAVAALLIVMAIHVGLFALVGVYARILGKKEAGGSSQTTELAADVHPRSGPQETLPPLLLWLAVLGLIGDTAAQGAVFAVQAVQATPSPAATARSAAGGRPKTQRLGHGLRLELETDPWPLGDGYWPEWVTVAPVVPLLADRRLVLEFRTQSPRASNGNTDLCVRRAVLLPAGSGPLRFSLSLPRWSPWNTYSLTVLENGDVLPALSTSVTSIIVRNPQWEWAFPRIAVMGSTEPDSEQLAKPFPIDAYYQQTSSTLPASKPLPSIVVLKAEEFPRRWIDYTSLDVVYLTLDQMTALDTTRPETLRALLAWVNAGGNLWVSGADRQQLPRLEHLLRGEQDRDPSDSPRTVWTEPDKTLCDEPLNLPYNPQGNGPSRGVPSSASPPNKRPAPKIASPRKSASPPPFLLRSLGLGLVVALASDRPFPGNEVQWIWLLNSMGSHRWLWELRHGLSIEAENPDFWKFLIPGIGLAPVTAFCVLITLFVVLIGPVNYGLLWRWKRLHLLVVTIPLGAGLVTAALLAYAMLADGFATRVRPRSLTWIDQHRGQAACWTRLSFYAGLSPTGGLTFPADVAIFPLEHNPASQRLGLGDQRVLDWEGDQQHLSFGWVPARTPVQLLTVRSRPTERGLVLLGRSETAAGPRIVNRLGTHISQLVVRSGDGRYYQAVDVARGATVALQPLATGAVNSLLDPIFRAHRPSLPSGMEAMPYTTMQTFGVGWNYQRYQFGVRPPSQDTSILEKAMSRCATAPGEGPSPRPGAPIPRGDYVAIVSRDPEVLLGTPLAHEEAGFHVICGEW